MLAFGAILQAQPRVGLVMPFENHTREANLDWIGESVAGTLSADLASPEFLMIGRRERATAFDKLGIPASSIVSDATIYKVADVLDADEVVLGNYEYQDGIFIVKAQVLDMQGPHLSQTFTESAPLLNLLNVEAGLAWQLQQFLRPGYPLSKEAFLAERPAPRLDAFENYVRGLLAKNRAQQIQFFRNAERLDPSYTPPAFELGMSYFQDHDYPTSILWLSKLRRNDPDYLEANYFLGLAYLHQEDYERSAASFRMVEQQLPMNEVYNNLGIVLARMDKPGALEYFEKAVQSDPTDPIYQFNLGYAQWKRGNCMLAGDHLRKALDTMNVPVWRALYIECLRKNGQEDEADRQVRFLPQGSGAQKFDKLERLKEDNDGSSFRQLLRVVQLQEERKHSKLSAVEHSDLHYQKALEYQKDAAERQAVEELAMVLELEPENSLAYLDLASIHFKAGRLEDAARSADQSLEREASPEGYVLKARVLAAQGKAEDAQKMLGSALRLDPSNSAAATLRDEWNARAASRQ